LSGEDESVLEKFIVKISKGTIELFLLHKRGAVNILFVLHVAVSMY
jgi:hypothetical protein